MHGTPVRHPALDAHGGRLSLAGNLRARDDPRPDQQLSDGPQGRRPRHRGNTQPKGLVLAAGAESVSTALEGLLPTLAGLGATGKAEEVTRLATLGATAPRVVVAVGLGTVSKAYDAEVLRRAAGTATAPWPAPARWPSR